MNEVTLVTAFFDIGRSNEKSFSRTNEKYLNDFKFWSRMNNEMIVFSDKYTIEEIKKIRNSFGLLSKTQFVDIEEYKSIDKELYESIKKSVNNNCFKEFHIQKDIPEAHNADYIYIMLLKEWCCNEVYKRKLAKGMIAWIDFGFNHGGEYYLDEKEFNFSWKMPLDDKIHLCELHKYDGLPPFEIIRRNDTYIQGCLIVAQDYLWKYLWNDVRTIMISLNTAGLADDDQLLLLMSYLNNPQKFILHNCPKWNMGLSILANRKFKVSNSKQSRKKIINKLLLKKISYSFTTMFNLINSSEKM